MSTVSYDNRIGEIRRKVDAGERLSRSEGVFLDEQVDLLTLGELANAVRERKNGNLAFYNTNLHLNPTNVCVYRCRFCAFRADLRADKAYTFDEPMVRQRAQEARQAGATEIHVVGGLHHQKKFEWYVDIVRILKDEYPELHVKAWTPVEIAWFSFLTKKPIAWVLEQMIEAGLGSMPGGGAEIFDPVVREQICEHKADSEVWFETHREAHRLGLKTNATMLYGHVEKAEHRIDHLDRLRLQQDESGGFQTFIPLAFHPENTGMDDLPKPSSMMDLRTMAISRLMLDNIDHIKAYWIMLGAETAQVALSFGADDIDGTVVHELIYHDAGAQTPESLTVEQLHRLIREAGREPVERDTLYRRVVRDGTSWHVGEPILSVQA